MGMDRAGLATELEEGGAERKELEYRLRVLQKADEIENEQQKKLAILRDLNNHHVLLVLQDASLSPRLQLCTCVVTTVGMMTREWVA
jgi:hypothetical protein